MKCPNCCPSRAEHSHSLPTTLKQELFLLDSVFVHIGCFHFSTPVLSWVLTSQFLVPTTPPKPLLPSSPMTSPLLNRYVNSWPLAPKTWHSWFSSSLISCFFSLSSTGSISSARPRCGRSPGSWSWTSFFHVRSLPSGCHPVSLCIWTTPKCLSTARPLLWNPD